MKSSVMDCISVGVLVSASAAFAGRAVGENRLKVVCGGLSDEMSLNFANERKGLILAAVG